MEKFSTAARVGGRATRTTPNTPSPISVPPGVLVDLAGTKTPPTGPAGRGCGVHNDTVVLAGPPMEGGGACVGEPPLPSPPPLPVGEAR